MVMTLIARGNLFKQPFKCHKCFIIYNNATPKIRACKQCNRTTFIVFSISWIKANHVAKMWVICSHLCIRPENVCCNLNGVMRCFRSVWICMLQKELFFNDFYVSLTTKSCLWTNFLHIDITFFVCSFSLSTTTKDPIKEFTSFVLVNVASSNTKTHTFWILQIELTSIIFSIKVHAIFGLSFSLFILVKLTKLFLLPSSTILLGCWVCSSLPSSLVNRLTDRC